MFKKRFNLRFIPVLKIFSLLLYFVQGNQPDGPGKKASDLFNIHLNMSDLGTVIRDTIEHYKLADPVGLPGLPIPDPMSTPDINYSKLGTNIYLHKSMIHGLSQFCVEEIHVDLNTLQVELLLSYNKLEMLGDYRSSSFITMGSGAYSVTIIDISMGGTALFETTKEGHLEAAHIDMDLVFKDIIMQFENPGILLNVLQGMVNTIGRLVFEQIKPYILREVNKNIQDNMNRVLRSVKTTFPNSISPLDLSIAEARKYVRSEGFDPFKVDDYKFSASLVSVKVTGIEMSGLSNFYRLGRMYVAVKKNTVMFDTDMSTQQLEGKCSWEMSLGRLISTYGTTSFLVDYVQVRTKVNQSLDLRNEPTLEELNITLGNIQLRMDGLGTLDYLLELVVNVLPNLLRYEIVNTLEGFIKKRIQMNLSALDMEELINKHVISQFDLGPDKPVDADEVIEDDSAEFTDQENDPYNTEQDYREIESYYKKK